MTNEDLHFLQEVQERARDPEWLEKIIIAAVSGTRKEAQETRQFATDMESVAAVALSARLYKTSHGFIAGILERNKARTGLDWTDQISKLKGEK